MIRKDFEGYLESLRGFEFEQRERLAILFQSFGFILKEFENRVEELRQRITIIEKRNGQ